MVRLRSEKGRPMDGGLGGGMGCSVAGMEMRWVWQGIGTTMGPGSRRVGGGKPRC